MVMVSVFSLRRLLFGPRDKYLGSVVRCGDWDGAKESAPSRR